jgi:hypothetical protein
VIQGVKGVYKKEREIEGKEVKGKKERKKGRKKERKR